jgi:hypothetical protein
LVSFLRVSNWDFGARIIIKESKPRQSIGREQNSITHLYPKQEKKGGGGGGGE